MQKRPSPSSPITYDPTRREKVPHDLPGHSAYADGMTATVPTANGQSNVRMTPAAIDALHELARPQAESVARAIAAIGRTEGKPVAAPEGNGRQYLAMVPDEDEAPVVMYREADDGGYLVTNLVDRATYKTYEIAEQPGFLQSTTFKATVAAVAAAAIGVIFGSRAVRSPHSP
jgi:hypothetical protein